MSFEGDLSVLQEISERGRALARSEDNNSRPALFVLGGVQRGVYGAGALTAMRERGLSEAFDSIVGISTGAVAAAYFLAEQTDASSIYYEECLNGQIYNFYRIFTGGYSVNTTYLTDVFRGVHGQHRLDTERIKHSRTAFYLSLAEYQTGKLRLYDIVDAPDICDAIRAAISMPWFSEPVEIDGMVYVDGGVIAPFPLKELIGVRRPTSILVIANSSRHWDYPWLYYIARLLGHLFLPRALSHRMRKAFIEHDAMFESLRSCGIPYLIIWSDEEVHAFTRDKNILKSAISRAHDYMAHLLDKWGE